MTRPPLLGAKLRPEGSVGAEGFTAVATRSEPLTGQGTLLGTLQYMAPEQLEGKEADARTDIFAFGALVYEMATGQRAFSGESQASLIAAILEREPVPMATLQSLTPARLDEIVKTCLAKDPDERWQSAGDVGRQVKGIIEGGSQPSVAVPVAAVPRSADWRRAVVASLATVVVGGTIIGVAVWRLTRPAPEPLARVVISAGGTEPLLILRTPSDVAISPDVQHVAYLTGREEAPQVQLRALEQLDPTTLVADGQPGNPFFSPDGQWVGFFDFADSTLKRVPVDGGPTVEICSLPDDLHIRGATWEADDTIVFGTNAVNSGLWQVHSGGGEPEQLTTSDGVNHRWPEMLPSGDAVLFTIMPIEAKGSVEEARLAVVSLEGGTPTLLNLTGAHPRYVPTGHVVYSVDGTLRAVRFDTGRLEVTSDPIPVVDGVTTKTSGAASFDVAQNGSLVYMRGSGPNETTQMLVWVDRDGNEEPLPLPRQVYFTPRASPDGTRIAVVVREDGQDDLWVFDAATGAGLKLTQGHRVRTLVWTPEGTRIVFSALEETFNLYVVATDGSGEAERLMASEGTDRLSPTSITPDGERLAFTRTFGAAASPHREIWEVLLDGDHMQVPLLQGEFMRGAAEYSPDGKWLVYRSDESGQMEVYAQPYPGPGPVVPVSIGGGNKPWWASDGAEIFYRLEDRVMAVEVDTDGGFGVGEPRELFASDYAASWRGDPRQYHVRPDGRFLMMREATQTTDDENLTQIVLVQNWHQELKRLVPVD